MKQLFFSKVLKTGFLVLIISLGAKAQQTQEGLDPDLPKNAQNIDKEAYLKARAEYINQKRGIPYNLPYDARAKAIAEKIKQENDNRNNPNSLLTAPNWVAEGPFPIPNGQTTGASVAVSGRVTAIAVHPTNANTVYVGTANGGVYRSLNGGTTWTAIFDNAQSLAIGALALAPSSPTTLFVGTGESALSADSYFGVGLYRIDNADVAPVLNGPINPGGIFTFRSISKILVDPTNAANVFVSTSTGVGGIVSVSPAGPAVGLFRTTNATAAAGSITFTKLTVATAGGGSRRVLDMVMEPGTPNNILCTVYGTSAAGDGGIYRSTDALAATPTFTRTFTLGTATTGWRGELAICKVGATVTVYAGADNGTSGNILKSTDGGATFAAVPGTFTFCGTQCFYDIAVAVDPGNASNFYIGGSSGNNIFRRSTNGGNSFTISTTNLHADVHAIVVAPSAVSTLYLGCDGGIFKSTDAGVTWASMNTAGFSATQYQSVALHPIDSKFSIGGAQDNGTSMYKPDGTWNLIDFGDGGYTLIDQNAADNTTVSMYHTYFNTSTAPAQIGMARVDLVANAVVGTWPVFGCFGGVSANGIACTGTVMFYAPMALGPGSPNRVYFGSDRLYRSIDKGANFTTVSQNPIVAGVAISTIAIAKQDDNYRLVGFTNGQVWGTSTGSSTLENITPAGAPAVPAQRVYFDPNNKNIAYVCYGGYGVAAGQHIWKTTNFNVVSAPATWVASGTGLPDAPVNGFAIDPGNSNVLYAGTDVGVYSSVDGGANWASFSSGLPIVPVFDMAVHPVTHNLRIATHGRGLWSTTSVVLPVTLTTFNATARDNGKVYLEWITETEQNNRGFEIERSVENGTGTYQWDKIGFVNGSGTSSTPKRYYYEDEPTGGKKFIYRLRQIDFDGKFKYSDSRLVTLRDFDYGLYSCYPNPVTNNAVIKYKIPDNNFVKISVYDNAGKLITNLVNESKNAGVYQVSLPSNNLAAGVYYYKMSAGNFNDTKSFTVLK